MCRVLEILESDTATLFYTFIERDKAKRQHQHVSSARATTHARTCPPSRPSTVLRWDMLCLTVRVVVCECVCGVHTVVRRCEMVRTCRGGESERLDFRAWPSGKRRSKMRGETHATAHAHAIPTFGPSHLLFYGARTVALLFALVEV